MQARTIAIAFLLLFCLGLSAGAQENKFLIIHLDAVSSVDMQAELAAGHLANIEAFFAHGRFIPYGISLFPGGTEMIYPRLKQGLDNADYDIVGWSRWDREKGKRVHNIVTFLDLFSHFSRRNKHQFLLGLPALSHLAGFSLLNIERLWENYDLVEFFWFSTDAAGHLLGPEAHLKSLRLFDFYFGLLAASGRLEGANVVIYTDHGLNAGEVQRLDFQGLIPAILGQDLLYVDYPNVYLRDPAKKTELAKKLAQHRDLDLVLVKIAEDQALGFSKQGAFEINKEGEKLQYCIKGQDFFAYDSLGYQGQFMSKDEWLHFTRDHLYPAAVPNLFAFLSNPRAGDIVLVTDFPKIPRTLTAWQGHHAGLRNTDLLVPLFLKGPAFLEVEEFAEFWLHELYTQKLPLLDFQKQPYKEKSEFSISLPTELEISVSPAYRWRMGASVGPGRLEPWLEYDLYSSFLTRVWLGVGVFDKRLEGQLRLEAFLGDFSLHWQKRARAEGQYSLGWRFFKNGEIRLGPGKVGLTVIF